MKNKKFTSWPCFTEEEADKVRAVLLSNKVNYWTGSEGRDFEKEFAAFTDSDFAVAVANGTLALDLALNALNIGARNGGSSTDEVIVTSRTFIASVSSIVLAGAIPVFADIDEDSQNITVESAGAVLSNATRAVIAVHLAGWPCDMDGLMSFANKHNLYVVEDCAQAHGAKYKGKSVGSIGDIGCWSFCQDKIMTTGGEGGMVTTNNKELWSRMWSFKDHGKSWEAVYERDHPPGFRWLHESFGTNWRMTEMQAAIGRIQLGRMTEWNKVRSLNAQNILTVCQKYPDILRVPVITDSIVHAWYKCYVFVRLDGLSREWSRDRIIEKIISHGVPCFSGSCSEVYLEKAFDGTDFRPDARLKTAKELGELSLMFLVHPSLSQEEIAKTCDTIEMVMEQVRSDS